MLSFTASIRPLSVSSSATIRFNFSLAQYQIGLYVLGTLGVIGSAIGRIPCGWLCPFGFFQEIMHKIPSPKLSIPGFMSYFRYVILALFVVILPFLVLDQFGVGQTWFCKFICPAGTLEAGVPLVAVNSGIRSQIGTLYFWKIFVLVLFLIWMVLSRRPFCRTTCPLGAIFGLFNKVSLFRMYVDESRCSKCNTCLKDCPVEIKAFESPNTPDCIRCLKCAKSCQNGAISYEFIPKKKYESEQVLKA